MKLLAFALGLIAMGFSLTGIARPDSMARLVRYAFSPSGLYVVAAVRVAIGVVFFLAASGSRAPRAMRVIGVMICGVSVALALATIGYGDELRDWWMTHGPAFVRWGSLFALALGAFVAYATAPSPPVGSLREGDHDVTELDTHGDVAAGGTTRRSVLLGAGALGAAGLLVACGDDPPATPPAAGATTAAAPVPATVPAADVPVGGGTILTEQNLVVTQPTAGDFKAFDATCTHQQCQVTTVSDSKITCACHNSQYDAATGAVTRGPAQRSLTAKTVAVSGDTLTIS